jgi:hypothetical protein
MSHFLEVDGSADLCLGIESHRGNLLATVLCGMLGCTYGSQHMHVECTEADEFFCVRCPALLQIARGCHELLNLLHAFSSVQVVLYRPLCSQPPRSKVLLHCNHAPLCPL